MEDRKIREKYGGHLAKAINRAIRAEIPGGNEALDKLTALAGVARHSGWKDRDGKSTVEALAYFRHKENVIDKMDAEVRKRWGVPMGMGRDEPAERVSKPRASAPRKPRGAPTAKPRADRMGKRK
jgi:hypothetical protein